MNRSEMTMEISRGLPPEPIPLVVDLDGTLVKTDLLWETVVRYVGTNPLRILHVVAWLLRGRAQLKRELAFRVTLDPARLPYSNALIAFLRLESSRGRTIVLATASDESVAQPVAGHLGLFSEVLASDGRRNLKSSEKSRALINRFGEKGFDYVGNGRADLAVWSAARKAIVVNALPSIERAANRESDVGATMETRRFALRTWLRALRVHQWAKNLIILVPVMTAHQISSGRVVLHAVVGLVLFSLTASAVYMFNDILDLDADRQHPVKRSRPFASGELSIWLGLTASFLLLLISVIGAMFLPYTFPLSLGAYILIATSYSTILKRKLMIDVVCLALLYTIRIIAGHAATGIKYSSWLLAFSLFLFFSLAMVKRFSELLAIRSDGQQGAKGRGYLAGDLEPVAMLGISSGSLAVLVLVLYVTSAEVRVLYRHPELLLLMAPVLLYWLGRIWTIAHRGHVNEDPVIFALRDKASYAAGLFCLAIMIAATL